MENRKDSNVHLWHLANISNKFHKVGRLSTLDMRKRRNIKQKSSKNWIQLNSLKRIHAGNVPAQTKRLQPPPESGRLFLVHTSNFSCRWKVWNKHWKGDPRLSHAPSYQSTTGNRKYVFTQTIMFSNKKKHFSYSLLYCQMCHTSNVAKPTHPSTRTQLSNRPTIPGSGVLHSNKW